MNRALWTQNLTTNTCPAWLCPTCGKGTIVLVPKSLTSKETIESKSAHSHDAWDIDWITYSFTARAQCGHASCKEEFVISGSGGVEPTYGPEGDTEYEDYFAPLFIYPMPDIIVIPQKSPSGVLKELHAAFKLFRINEAACAGRIRVALEYLMDHVGVPKKKKDKNGKFFDLTLHKRIDVFAQDNAAIGPQLMALKWLGNTGSHDSQVSQSDLLDAFEILEHALSEIIDERSTRVAALAKKLTKKHGK